MKLFFAIFLCLLNNYLLSQALYTMYPNDCNEFISSRSINWAANDNQVYSFTNSNKIEGKNIYDYILSGIKSKSIFPFKNYEMFGDEVNPYDLLDKPYYSQLNDSEITTINLQLYKDSLKSIKFNQIFYLDNYCLKSQIISGSPQYLVITDHGLQLGYTGQFSSCINNNVSTNNKKNSNSYFVKQIKSQLNFEDASNATVIKETYGMNLVLSLWYGASTKNNKVFDLKTNKEIHAKDVMSYSIFDSVTVQYFSDDSILSKKVQGAPSFRYLTNLVEFEQNIFYDKANNYFYSIISEAILSVKYYNLNTQNYIEEKRFKVVFE